MKLKSATSPGAGCAKQAGFTLAELLVVASIIAVVICMSVPALSRAIDNAQLKGAAQAVVSAYQDARVRATQNNTPYEVLVSASGITPAQVCVDLNGDGLCNGKDPLTPIPGHVSLNNNGVPPGLSESVLGFTPITNTESSVMHDQNNDLTPGLAWNGVGMPCQRSSSTSPCTAVGWVQYLQLRRPSGDLLYAAVSVSPTGRIRTWTYTPSASGNGSWF